MQQQNEQNPQVQQQAVPPTINFNTVLEALQNFLDPNLDPNHALDLAFFFVVLDLFDYKFSVDLRTIGQLFREDFKIYLINAKLRQISGTACLDISDNPNSKLFSSLYLVLAGNFFSDLDDLVDAELHSLVKCVPKIIAGNHLDIQPSDIDEFVQNEASTYTLEQLS